MRIRFNQLRFSLGYEPADLVDRISQKLQVSVERVEDVRVVRRSIDARGKSDAPVFRLVLEVKK